MSKMLNIFEQCYGENARRGDESQIVHGVVQTIDPLRIRLDDGRELPSSFFHLSDFVIDKRVKFRVHRASGTPHSIIFNGIANSVSKTKSAQVRIKNLAASIYSKVYNATVGRWGASALTPPELQSVGVSSVSFNKTLDTQQTSKSLTIEQMNEVEHLQNMKVELSLNSGIDFEMEVIEHEPHRPLHGSHQDQTTIIEGVVWRGLKPGDIVMMTSHNHNQKYLVHSILNRDRNQYEHGWEWSSREADGFATHR